MRPLVCLLLLSACSPREIEGTQAFMKFSRGSNVWNAPVPSNDLILADGHIDVSGFPNTSNNNFVGGMLSVIENDARGFSPAAAIMFRFTGPLGTLPDLAGSQTGPVLLVSVDPDGNDYLTRYPVRAEFLRDGGPFGAANMLALLPLQGRPLRPKTRYAAVVLRKLNDKDGKPLGVPLAMSQLAFGVKPDGMNDRTFDEYMAAIRLLDRELGIFASAIAAMTVFTTDDVTGTYERARERILAEPRPAAAFSLAFTYPTYCVYEATVSLPVYQSGVPPYFGGGGNWVLDESGAPVLQTQINANLVVTVPKTVMPSGGFPTVVYMRQGGSGRMPIADRGTATDVPPARGSGPAQEFAKVGYAGVSLDGPHGGLRNPSSADEQLLLFNFFNPLALRDNMRESALEIDLLANMLDDLRVDASACGGGTVQFDTSKLVLMGHSTGAWITPIAAAFEPKFKNVIMSGAGASWVENILFKKSPLDVAVVAKGILDYTDRELTEFDPAVMLAQWAADPADPQHYARHIITRPPASSRNVLVFQGIVDSYIMPPIANALNLSVGLDLGGPELDGGAYASLAPFANRKSIALPASLNRVGTRPVTAVLVQHQKDQYQDGHEVMFQREEAKYQYRCFLRTLRDEDAPRVPEGLASPDLCP
jgi:hypothetical protein